MRKFISVCLVCCLFLSSSFCSLATTQNDKKTTGSVVIYQGVKYDLSTLEGASKYFQDTGKIKSMFQNVSKEDLENIREMIKNTESISSTSLSDSSISTRAVDGPPLYNLESKLQANAKSMKVNYKAFYNVGIINMGMDPITAANYAYVSVGVYFADKVQIGGEWDFKQYLGWNNEYKVYIDGKYHYMFGEDIGNIHYGYVGKTYFPSLVLQSAAGLVQIIGGEWRKEWLSTYFDDPNDNKAIKAGIEYYDSGSFEW